jgi:peptide/nickel transport system substrate-binding protein
MVVAGFAAATLLAACSGDGSAERDGPAGSSAVGGVGSGIDSDREPPAAPVEGAVRGGTLTVLSADELSATDPTDAYIGEDHAFSLLSGLVTRSLTQYVYDPATGSMVLVPDIATDTGRPNADFTEWSFTIRDGVRFEDGTEVTAEDVAFGIERSFDRADFPYGLPYNTEYFLDGDTYRGPYRSGTSYPGVVVDGSTLTIKMARPFPDMPYLATYPAMGPIPERGSNPATYWRHPLATGPYKFAAFSPGKSLTLVRNEQWDPDTDPGRHAYPDRYVFDFTKNRKQVDATILGDSARAQTSLTTNDRPLPGDYRRAQQLNRVTEGSTLCTLFLSLDYRKITDIRVRQAIGYAFPYKEAMSAWYGFTFGVTLLPGQTYLPPGFPARQTYPMLDTDPGQTDPDKAKALLKDAGYAPGQYELKYAYDSSDPVLRKANDLIVPRLQAAGFKVTLFGTSNGDEWGRVNEDPNAPINIRTHQGWCPDWPSGAAVFPPLFDSTGFGNATYFAEPAVDQEIDRISDLPIDAQPAAWAALDKTIMTKYYPVVVLGYLASALLHGSKIGGMNIDNVTGGVPTWKDLYLRP